MSDGVHGKSDLKLQNRGGFLTRAVFLAFFSFLTVGLGNIIIVGVDPARETVEAFNLQKGLSQLLCFWVALLYWALCAWYTARLLLEKSFAPFDSLLPCVSERFARVLIKWTPRGLGVAAIVPIALVFLIAQGMKHTPVWVRISPLAVAVVFLGFIVFRRKFFGELVELLPQEPGYGYRRFGKINWKGWVLLWLLGTISLSTLLLVWIGGAAVARWVGAPALLLIALGSWSIFGGFVLIYVPMAHGYPAWTPWPLVLAALFSLWMENHNVPVGPRPSARAAPEEWVRPTLDEHWRQWRSALDATACKDKPIYLVSIAGGATRAAFWSAHTLAVLERDERRLAAAEGREPCFARSTFAISGVSGGALGAATFVSLLAQEQVLQRQWSNLPLASADFLGRDVLAPVLGYMLFQDGLQRFLPYPIASLDRSHGLEDTWISDWADMVQRFSPGDASSGTPNWFARPMRDLYADGRGTALPSLFLNTTRVADGKKVVQSNLRYVPNDAYDIYAPGLLTGELTLAGAVHNSARFTYVSPAGRVWHWDEVRSRSRPWGYVVDGGYFENSGSATLAPLIREIGRLDPANSHRLVLIMFSNQPSDGATDYVCDDPAAPELEPKPAGPRESWPRFLRERLREPGMFAMEVAAPAIALYQTRASRAHAADLQAKNAVDRVCASGRIVELRIPIPATQIDDPPMSWFLNERTIQGLTQRITEPAAAADTPARRLCENVELLKWRMQTPVTDTSPRLLLEHCRQRASG